MVKSTSIKRLCLLALLIVINSYSFAQQYKVEQLKPISTIWSEAYLFHPQIVLTGNTVQWEKQLVDFLPTIKNTNDVDEFTEQINKELLSYLNDDFTLVQRHFNIDTRPNSVIEANSNFDYAKIEAADFEDISRVHYWASKLSDSTSNRPIVIDLRLDGDIDVDYHSYNFLEYFLSMFIQSDVVLSQNVIREHFGWDEYNEWWHYEQRWSVANKDLDIISNGKLLPLSSYQQILAQRNVNIVPEGFKQINRPLFFIVNNSFNSYYGSLLSDVRTQREHTYIISEDKGGVYTPFSSGLKRYELAGFDFILNPTLNVSSNNKYGLCSDLSVDTINSDVILSFINSDKQEAEESRKDFSLTINPIKYSSTTAPLTLEEKIMGLIKAHAIIKYFHIKKDAIADAWDANLDTYLVAVQDTKSDKEYFEMLLKMFSSLDDSHVFVEHGSMLDFSALFVVPVEFDWIENRTIITSVTPDFDDRISVGDEILAIDGVTMLDFIDKKRVGSSHSNEQGLICSAITFTNFTGTPGSVAKYTVKRNGTIDTVSLERNSYLFSLLGNPKREGAAIDTLEGNIGYLDIAKFMDDSQLIDAVEQIKNTDGLIIDLRNSYPVLSIYDILPMFCREEVVTRIAKVPIVSAYSKGTVETSVTTYEPNPKYLYSKPVVVLIDKSMISRPEDVAMTLSAFDNVTFIGEQTQGTNGEMTKIHLPGSGSISFTGQTIKHGDGSKFQGVGVIPDIRVNKTINGVMNHKDEVLDRALQHFK